MDQFDVEIRTIHAGHPQSNGQAEKFVDVLKEKMKAIMAEVCNLKKFKKNFFFSNKKVFFFNEQKHYQLIGMRPYCIRH